MTRRLAAKVASAVRQRFVKIIFNGDLQAGETARHFSGRAARQGDGLLCVSPEGSAERDDKPPFQCGK